MIRTALMLLVFAGCGAPRQQTLALRETTAQRATDRAMIAPNQHPPLKEQNLQQQTTPLTATDQPRP
jgi:hypothetical protein